MKNAARIQVLQARLNSLVNPRLRDVVAIRAEIALLQAAEAASKQSSSAPKAPVPAPVFKGHDAEGLACYKIGFDL